MTEHVPAKCATEYCSRDADRSLAPGNRCYFHSTEVEKPTERMIAAIVDAGEHRAKCRGWVIHVPVRFEQLPADADFRDATFKEPADFTGCRIENGDFSGVKFEAAVAFRNVTFQSGRFESIKALAPVDFSGATLTGVELRNCKFVSELNFDNVTLSSDILCTSCAFDGRTFFTRLSGRQMVFDRAEFRGRSYFNDTDMGHVALRSLDVLAGLSLGRAKNVGSTEFHDISWPKLGLAEEQDARRHSDSRLYRDAERVYRELRRGAEGRRQYVDWDWLDRRELEMRRLERSTRRPLLWGLIQTWLFSAEALYSVLSDYGQSLMRPLYWLLALTLFAFPMLFALAGISIDGVTYRVQGPSALEASPVAWSELAAFSARTAALLPPPEGARLTPTAEFLQVALRIVGPLFGFLFSVAVRRKLRR